MFAEHLRKRFCKKRRKPQDQQDTRHTMLAHLKAKRRNSRTMSSSPKKTKAEDEEFITSNCASMGDHGEDNEVTQMTCDVLCSLGSSPQPPCSMRCDSPVSMEGLSESQGNSSKTCPKQLQLPMFLSSKFKFDDADHSCRLSLNP
jgi:hypothetical protein